jgi:hypothetical protein
MGDGYKQSCECLSVLAERSCMFYIVYRLYYVCFYIVYELHWVNRIIKTKYKN